MQLFECCTLLLLVSIRCLRGSRLRVEKLSVDDNRNAQNCLETLISLRFWPVHDFVIIFDEMDIVDDNFLQRFSNFRWKLYSVKNTNLTGLSNVIIFASNFDSLRATMSVINFRRMDSRAKFVISVAKNFASSDEIKMASTGISSAMWKSDKTDVVYLVPCKADILAMTYFPFAEDCQVGEFEVLDVWREKDFVNRAELFPAKMLDIRGCGQNHSVAFPSGGVLSVQKEFAETGEMMLGGIGGRLITIVVEKMNMKLYTVVQPPDSWPLLADQVARGESILALSGTIPLAGQSEVLDLNSAYMEESFGLSYNVGVEVSWKNLVSSLSKEVWQYTGYVGLLFCGLIFIANRSEIAHKRFRILDCFGIFLGTARVLPRSYFGRFLFGMWIIYSYLINASYNSGLVSFLTTPNERTAIETLQDLLADGIDFGGATWHRELYNDPSDPVMMKIYDNFKIWSENESLSLLMNRQCVTGLLTTFVYMYNSNQTDNANHKLCMLKEKALTYQVPISMRRGSPFAFGVRRYTSRAIQGGFHEYWLKYYTRKLASARIESNFPIVISMQHIRGILYLHIAGLFFSCLVFLGELIFHKYFRNRRFPQFLHTYNCGFCVMPDDKTNSGSDL